MAYKHVIRAKTKNLFDISKVTNYPPTYNVDNSYLKTKPLPISSIIFLKETLIQLCPNLVSGNTYVFNAKTTGKYQQILLNDIVWEFGTARTLTDADLNKTIGLYAEPTNTADEWTIISEIQIEEGSTPTPYTPYSYLSSNKRMIKVSDVCQLLDKSKYVSKTWRGITATPQADGSWILTGKNNADSPLFLSIQNEFKCIIGHKYLMQGNSQSGQNIIWYCQDLPTTHSYIDAGNGLIFTPVKNKLEALFRVLIGVTCNNVVMKPQLFDLTEMFGSGHEPATVAEFRQRFPNEYYPYSPQCWLTSYKSAVVCKTKNLFDISKVTNYPPTYNVDNSYLKTKPLPISSIIFLKETLIQLCPNLVSGNTYVFNAKTTGKYQQILLNDIVWEFGTARTLTDADLNKTIGLYAEPTNTADEWTIISEIQIEEGSTPTPYTPYSYLSSNKRMIKVSDVCQLLDKSKYVSKTWRGITATPQADGSWILTGKNNADSPLFLSIQNEFKCIIGHKYLMQGNSQSGQNIIWYCQDLPTTHSYIDAGNGLIFTPVKNKLEALFRVLIGVTCNNVVMKPQLFDLTEMFGSGHEPATVAEFRQRFPNEYYPYSPQCWLTSYKSAVVCKTKNLFDVNNAVPYRFDNNNPPSDQVFVKDGIYTTRLNNYNIGSGLRIKDGWKLPAGMYTLSVKVVDCTDFGTNGFADTGFYYKTADGTWHSLTGRHHSYAPGTTLAFAINIPEHIELRLYLNYQNMNGQPFAGYVSYKDIQVEQGSTATSYVPYQHL